MSDRLFFRCALPANIRPRSLTRSLRRSPSRSHSGRKFFERDQKRKLLRRQRKEWKRKEGSRGQSRRRSAGGRRCGGGRERRSEAGREDGNGTRIINSRTRGTLPESCCIEVPISQAKSQLQWESRKTVIRIVLRSPPPQRPHLFARSTPCPYASEIDQTWQSLEKQLQVW